jgi:Rhamnan synthesis protein F
LLEGPPAKGDVCNLLGVSQVENPWPVEQVSVPSDTHWLYGGHDSLTEVIGEKLDEPSESGQRVLSPLGVSAVRRSGEAEARAVAAERLVLKKALATARMEVRLATIGLRRGKRELERQRRLMERAVARERGRTEKAKQQAKKWRKKHDQVTSTLVWLVYSSLDRALRRIRSALRPPHQVTEASGVAKLPEVPEAGDLAHREIESKKKHRATSKASLKMAESPSRKNTGAQLSIDNTLQPTARPESADSAAPVAPTFYRAPSLGAITNSPMRGRIAVILHLFYPELWPEFRDALTCIPEPFDLFVTLVAGYSEEAEDWIRTDYPVAQIIIVENRGRDILPFILLINAGVLNRYHLVCKLHSKRTLRRADGDDWRRVLIRGVLLDEFHVASILAAFDDEPELGIVVADGYIRSGHKDWWRDVDRLNELCARAGMPVVTSESGFPEFPAGSIFWIRASLLRRIAALMLTPADFEAEPLPRNGCTPHAVERLVGLVCRQAGMRVFETSEVLRARIGKRV